MIRTFIAIDLSFEIKSALELLIKQLDARGSFPIRWTSANNIHITLKFLGDVEEKRLPEINFHLTQAVRNFHPFDIRAGGLGAFPKTDRARIIWVGCDLDPEGYQLQKAVEEIMTQLDFPKEDRSFSPHLTIGRVTDAASSRDYPLLARLVRETSVGSLGMQSVDRIRIYRSDLTAKGPNYKALYDLPLGKNNQE